jgi:hypothetical protein
MKHQMKLLTVCCLSALSLVNCSTETVPPDPPGMISINDLLGIAPTEVDGGTEETYLQVKVPRAFIPISAAEPPETPGVSKYFGPSCNFQLGGRNPHCSPDLTNVPTSNISCVLTAFATQGTFEGLSVEERGEADNYLEYMANEQGDPPGSGSLGLCYGAFVGIQADAFAHCCACLQHLGIDPLVTPLYCS